MSEERYFSLDRAQSKQQRENIHSGRYIPERSPNRKSSHSRTASPQHVPSAPEVYSRNYGGGVPPHESSRIQYIPFDDDPGVDEPLTETLMRRPLDLQDFPGEFLDEFEEPSFYDPPPNASFDEIMCVMATPPAPTAAEKLDSFRAKVADVIEIDDLRKRMAAHIGTTGEEKPAEGVQVDDVRRRMAALIGESKPQPPLRPYKIAPLPEDPHAIPPPPKDPKDVVAIIRRAKAIARLKALEEAKSPKVAVKRGARGAVASRKLIQKKPVPSSPKPVEKAVRSTKLPKVGAPRKDGLVSKKKMQTPQHPPDYVPDEWAAAILRTRKLAGLKTVNPKLLPKVKIKLSPVSKSPLPKPSTPKPPTFEDIKNRVAAIRSKTDVAKAKIADRKEKTTIRGELNEYDALEQLYGATTSGECPGIQERVNDLQNRLDDLQQQILQTPLPAESSLRSATPISPIELDEFEALEELYGAALHDQCPATEDIASDLQHRINTLQQKLFQSPKTTDVAKRSPIYEIPSILRYQNLLKGREAMAAAAAQACIMQRAQVSTESENEDELSFADDEMPQSPLAYITPPRVPSRPPSRVGTPFASRTPKRSRSPAAASQICPSRFDDTTLSNIDMPDFNLNEIPEFAFSAEALENGFDIENELSLGEISMPTLDEDISFDELGLEDITSPDLCDLSISGTELALEPDYNLEISTEEEQDEIADLVEDEPTSKQPGFLTAMVNALVNRFKNIFSPSQIGDRQHEEDEDELNLDSSLPNLFETTPSPKPKISPPKEPVAVVSVKQKPPMPEGPIVIPPHPKNPKDYKAIVKRARTIKKKKAQEAAMAPVAAPPAGEKKKKLEIKSSIPKRAPLLKKKISVQKKKKDEKPEKVYPPGEYSPSYARAVARARSIAGLKNISAILNPERAARIAEIKAEKEAELAAIEALPPVERMRKKMEGMRKRVEATLPRPSIEALGTLEAIRANLPIPKPPKRKWRPTGRLRADRRVEPKDRIFIRDFGRVLIPTKKTQQKKGWRELEVMSPFVEEPQLPEGDLMQFSPLKPHEGQMRLQYLREETAKRAAETIKAAEEAQAAISFQTPPGHQIDSPSYTFGTPQMTSAHFAPFQLESPSSPRTEETRREKVITKVGPNGGKETIREEVTETSTIENGEVHTSTRHVTTKTDEFGNVTCHIQEGKGLSGEEEVLPEDLSNIEPPDFMDTSDIPPPVDPSIPTPAEIIDRIRSKVQQKLNFSIPAIPKSPRTPSPITSVKIDFPENLPEEELFDTEIPEFERTPPRPSPQARTFSPFEKDQRMYAWREIPQPTPPPRMPTPKVSTPPPESPKYISPSPQPKSLAEVICIPPHPKDPKDYMAMVKRAQAIQKLKKEQDELAAKTAHPKQPAGKSRRIPISRWVGPPPKDPKRPLRKRLVLKKRAPKVSPKKEVVQQPEEEDYEDRECPTEPPPLPQEYREAVARARLIRGLKNRTAALNPAVAAKLAAKKAAEEAAQAAFDALPEHEKIKKRMEKVRQIPAKKRHIAASADILGVIAAIRANMPPIEDVLRQPSPYRAQTVQDLPVSTQATSPQTPSTAYSSVCLPQAPMRVRPRSASPSPVANKSLDEFEFMERYIGAKPVSPEDSAPVKEMDEDNSFEIPDISLLRPYVSPEQVQSTSPGRCRIPSPASHTAYSPENPSLEEFEKLEAELKHELSLDEFEALEAEVENLYNLYDTPKRGERHCGRNLAHQFPPSLRPRISAPHTPSQMSPLVCPPLRPEELSPAPFVPASSMRMLGEAGFFHEQELFDEESILGNKSLKRPYVTPRADAKPGSIYYDEMQDFKIPVEHVELDSSQLMPQTPPKDIQERFQRLKEAHEKRTASPRYAQQFGDIPATPTADFSPIRLISPSGAPCVVPEQRERQISPINSPPENEWLLNIDESPGRQVAPVKQLRDLEDMPFDELEYEIEPSLTNISFEKPVSPPPRPSDIISRIRSKVQQQLKERAKLLAPISPVVLQIPEELPDEELFELSAPSFARTPPRTPPAKYRSPRVSLPMAWGEVAPVIPPTPVTPPPRIPTPIKEPSLHLAEEVQEIKCPSPIDPIIIPPHPKDPRDYAAMIRRAQAIYKLKKQEEVKEAARAPPPELAKKVRVPISRWQGPPPKKVSAKPRRKLVLKKRVQQPVKTLDKKKPTVLEGEEEIECPAEPPPLPQEYRDAVARARLIHGLKNRTAALNPKIQAAVAAYNALPEHEKIKIRMERLRKKPHRRRAVKPTMEQIAYLEALKHMREYQYSPPTTSAKCPTPRVSVTPRAKVFSYEHAPSPVTPRADSRQTTDDDSRELAEFEALEQFESAPVCPSSLTQDNALKQRIASLEEQLLEAEGFPEQEDISLAEFEALEAREAPSVPVCPSQPVNALDLDELISDLQQQQLVTPPKIDPRERYRQLIAQIKTPKTPVVSPVKTPEIRYSPITLPTSSSREEAKKRAEKSTTQITRSGNNTIKEQVFETSEIVNGELQHFTTHVTTTTDPQGNVTCQINESKRISARDRSDELETTEDLGDIHEPSFFETTPSTPIERPRPRDLIEKVRRQVKESYKPEVPTGQLVELRTPPRMLPLPEDVPEEELLDFSCPAFERTPTQTHVRTPTRSPVRTPDVSIPQLFAATPPPPTPPLPPVSPLRHRIPSPEGPLVIPRHPKDPRDFKAMCRRARKIQQLIEQNEAELRAAAEAEAAAAVMAAAEASKPKKKERVPISRWTAPPPKKPRTRKKLVMRKHGDAMATKTPSKPTKLDKTQHPVEDEEIDYSEPPPLPEHFAEEVALARRLAGLKSRTAQKLTVLNAPHPSPIRDYATAISRIKEMKEKGIIPRSQPSLASAAYLDAVKGAMQVQQLQQPVTGATEYESPKTRYERILAERTIVPPTIAESPLRTPSRDDIPYSPVRFVSPRIEEGKLDLAKSIQEYDFDANAFESLDELEDLGEFEEPSYIDVSQFHISSDQYMPITPPQTPPPVPSDIISRIRQQYGQRQAAICPESPPSTPTTLEFPEDLPDEELFELSAPSFAKSPIRSETPIKSPNISIPHYFETSPSPAKPSTSISKFSTSKSPVASPPLLGVCPGINVKTLQGLITIPPHPKDPTDVAAIIRRAQIIQKLQAKEAVEKAAVAAKATKVRLPISKRAAAKLLPKTGKLIRKQVPKKKAPDTKTKSVAPPSTKECPTEPPELPAEYIAEVAKARRLAGLKTKTALLNPKVAARQLDQPPDYATIMERAAALRAAKAKTQQGPTARELAHRQHLINRQQRQERKRLLLKLERLRRQQDLDKSMEFEPTKTPPLARERLQAIKSRIQTETPTTSVYPYSPVKTPDVIDMPQYQPLILPPTPPFQHLKNVYIPDIENMSMPFDDLNDNMDYEIADLEDLQFRMAEAEAANAAYTEYDENNNIEWENAQSKDLDAIQQDFDIADRIEMLQNQLMESSNEASFSPRSIDEYNMAKRIEMLQNQLLQTLTRQQSPNKDDISQFDKNEPEQYDDQQDIYDEMIDDFEAMERECQ